MKRIDLLTVLVSSVTLLLFCLCSYLLMWQYSKIRDDIDKRHAVEIDHSIAFIELLEGRGDIDRVALADHLESNIRTIKGNQQEWQLLRDTLKSFVFILVMIVVSHLAFVYTVIKAALNMRRNQ